MTLAMICHGSNSTSIESSRAKKGNPATGKATRLATLPCLAKALLKESLEYDGQCLSVPQTTNLVNQAVAALYQHHNLHDHVVGWAPTKPLVGHVMTLATNCQ